jgi:hypothetical protein
MRNGRSHGDGSWSDRRSRRAVGVAAALVLVVVLAACDPPDGRDLSVVVADPPASIEVGGSTTFEAVVANVGSAPATGATINVLAPLGVAIVVEGTMPCSAQEYAEAVDQVGRTCPVGTVAAGMELVVTVTLTGQAAGGVGDVVVSALSTGGAEPKGGGGAPHVVRVPFEVDARQGVDLHVTGGGLEQPIVKPAPEVSRTTVVNRGTEAAGPVTVTQQLSGPVTVGGTPTLARADGGATGSCTTAGLTVTCTTGAHPVAPYSEPGDRWLLSVPVGSTASFPTAFTVTHTATSPDPEPVPDRWPTTASVQGSAEGLFLVLAGPDDVPVGSTFEVSVAGVSHSYWGPYYQFTVPANMRLESPCRGTGSFSCIVNTPVLTFQLTALAPGGPADFGAGFQAEGLPGAGGSIPIEVVDPAITSDVHPSSIPPFYGLVGEVVTVDGEVRTGGPTLHEDVVVEAEAPVGTVVESAQWGDLRRPCAVSGQTIRCEVGDVPGHSQVPVEVDLRAYRRGTAAVTFTATSATPQDAPDPWPDTIVVEVPIRTPFTDLGVTVTLPQDPPVPTVSYSPSYQVRNYGSEPATGVVLTVVLPEGFSLSGTSCTHEGGGVLTCPMGTLAPGQARLTSISTWPGPPIPSSFEATVVGDQPEPDPDPHPNALSTPVEPLPAQADLVTTITPPTVPSVVGETTGRTVRIENRGPSTVTGVTWDVTVPDGWRLDGITGTSSHLCTLEGNRATCDLDRVTRGSTTFLGVRLTPLEVRSGDVLRASIAGDLPDPDPASNVAEAILTSVPVSVDIGIEPWQYGDSPDKFVPGGSGSRTYDITNDGPAIATDVVITGSVPTAATITGASGSQLSCTWQAHEFTCIRPTLLARDSVVLQLDLTWANVPGPLTYHLAASAAQPEASPDVLPNTLDHVVISTAQPTGIEGVVVAPDGSPVAGATVRFWQDTDGFLSSHDLTTDANGRFALRGVPLGRAYRLSIRPPTGSPWAVEWYQDVTSRATATLLTVSTATPLHVIQVRLG